MPQTLLGVESQCIGLMFLLASADQDLCHIVASLGYLMS